MSVHTCSHARAHQQSRFISVKEKVHFSSWYCLEQLAERDGTRIYIFSVFIYVHKLTHFAVSNELKNVFLSSHMGPMVL